MIDDNVILMMDYDVRMHAGDDPKTIKTRLRQWAKVVACSVKQLRR